MPSIHIQEYIDNYTRHEKNVKRRGVQLFKNERVLSNVFNEKTDTWTFKVKGTRLYTVVVKLTNNKIETTTCNCPYDWGAVCKHTVAALMKLEELSNNPKNAIILPNPLTQQQRGIDEPFELYEYENISFEFIDRHKKKAELLDWQIRELHKWNFKFINNELIFKLIYKFSTNSHNVKVFKKNNKIYILSDEKSSVNRNSLKKSEALVLFMISTSPNPNLINFYLNGEIDIRKKKIFNDFGLPPNINFDRYFRFDFDNIQGIKIYREPPAYGLLPVTDTINDGISTMLSKITENIENKLIDTIKEKRDIGFVISFAIDIYRDYDSPDNKTQDFNIISFNTITGTPDKTGKELKQRIKSFYNIEELENFDIDITNNQRSLITLIERFNTYGDVKEDTKKIITLLANEKFIFLRETNSLDRTIRKKDISPAVIDPEPVKLIATIEKEGSTVAAKIKLKHKERIFTPEQQSLIYNYGVIKNENKILHIDDNNVFRRLDGHSVFRMAKKHKDQFFNTVVEPLSKVLEIKFNDDYFNIESLELDFSKKQIFLDEKGKYITITPQVIYGEKSVPLNTQNHIIEKREDKIIEYKRNFELEEDFIGSITALHPDFAQQKNGGFLYLHHKDFIKDMWFFNFFDHMQQNDVEVYGLKELKSFKYSPFKGKLSTSIESGQDWFDVNVDITFGNEQVSLADIRKAIINKQRYVLLKDGSVGILPIEWFSKLEKYFRNGEVKNNELKISKLRFSIIDELFENIDDKKIIDDLNKKRKLLSQFKKIDKVAVPATIKAELRDYQKEGLNWLSFLNKMQWGGILADDMGLGKTLQVLTFLTHVTKKRSPANLIVVPTTLLFNWQKEIEKFAPKTKALYHYGSDRDTSAEDFDKYNIVFTTYGILLRDIEMLKEYTFNYLILDESQAIKNPHTKKFKAAVLINAKNKIALTGTPIENSTFDLYAQISFVNPGMLGTINSFKTNYSNPIDKEGNEQVAVELQKIINPFVLRRTKEQVATELPPKIEDVIFCDMDKKQREVYDAYRNEYRNKLLKKIEEEGLEKSKFMVLEALTRLRQICDSPALLKNNEIDTTESVKIKEIVNHITEKTAQHKVLLFSQFVEMLSLIKDELNKRGIAYEYLDGKSSTTQREASVENFQNNDDLRVFLISLKAGGTGLNLTAADYVYIVDPWWNPAVENQAIDRCYRIGQDKHVFAYRMICKDTVEEKILSLQAKKKKIAQDIIQTDDNIMKTIDMNDIKGLFG